MVTVAKALNGDGPAAQLPDHPAPAARVALVADRWLEPAEWSRRGLTLFRLGPVTLEQLIADVPAAIVLDVVRGDARQVAWCWQLRDLLCVPLIVLAQGMASDDVAALLERGADEVVTDAPDGAELAAHVAAILRRMPRRAMDGVLPALQLGDVHVDMVNRVVHRPDGALSLSPTEFRLLLALLHAGGSPCPHAQLATRVWGSEFASATHYLRLYVRYLRKKLEQDPMRPRHILNVRGVGYRLVVDPAAAPAGTVAAAGAAARAVAVPPPSPISV